MRGWGYGEGESIKTRGRGSVNREMNDDPVTDEQYLFIGHRVIIHF